jgi:hypothetical protein
MNALQNVTPRQSPAPPPFGLSLSKPFTSFHLVVEGKRFDRLTANGVGQRFRELGGRC